MFSTLCTPFGLLLSLCFLCLKISATNAPGFSVDLGIQPNALTTGDDTGNGVNAGYLTYTGYVKYDQNTKDLLNDDQIIGLANQAYLEMLQMHSTEAALCGSAFPKAPSVMTAMAIGNEVYFGSSIRSQNAGKLFYIKFPDSEMTKALNACSIAKQTTSTNPNPTPRQHKTGSCGELIAIAMYVQMYSQLPRSVAMDKDGKRLESVNARIAAWGDADGKGPTGGYNLRACGNSQTTFGCQTFVTDQGLTPLLNADFTELRRSQPNPPSPPQVNKVPDTVQPGGLTLAKLFPYDVLESLDSDPEIK